MNKKADEDVVKGLTAAIIISRKCVDWFFTHKTMSKEEFRKIATEAYSMKESYVEEADAS